MPRPAKASNEIQSIHPTLKAALSSLDVQLEEELARYRRQRRAVPVMAASRIGQASPPPSLEVVNLYLPSSSAPAIALPATEETTTKALPGGDAPNPLLNSPNSPSNPQLRAATGKTVGNEDSRANALVTGDPQTSPTPPEDYLESSEQLLKSLAEEPKKSPSESPEEQEAGGLADNLLTPLGMGSMLLLLLSSASIGYLLFNPALVQRLGLNRFFPAAPVAVSPSPIATVSPSIAPPAISPNLANGGLENLDRSSLSNLKPSENPTRSPIPSVPNLPRPSGAVATPGKTNPSIVSGSPDLAGQLGIPPVATPLATPPNPAAPAAKPSPSPAAARPAPSPSPASGSPATNPRRDTYFYVVAAYDGDRSLSQARAVIPEAYIAEIPNQGTQIQMGAFLVEAEAKALIQELKQKGITASVYQPN